jgi:GntR family transcriptional regulator/MocR family aminotransferase
MKQTPWLALSIDRNAKTPVFEQICAALRKRMIAGDLAQGCKLPPTRVVATELGASRSTIVTAYEQLVAEGYLSSLQGSGYTVCALGEVELSKAPSAQQAAPRAEPLCRPLPFASSQPDMRLFPHRQWAKCVARVCRSDPQALLAGGADLGNRDLRSAISGHLSEWRGIEAAPHQIFVTAGSTDALEICLRALADKDDVIGLETPGYPPMRQFTKAHGVQVHDLPIDDHGAQVPPPNVRLQLAVLTPSHQYPLGGAMTPNRRQDFLQWARTTDAWIIEDDYDSEFRYAGRPIPAMAGFDQLQRTIYVGSFSKVFSNTLRLGYVVVPENLIERFRQTLHLFGIKASAMPQQALADFMTSGEFYRHIRRVRRTYGERRRFLLDSLKRDFAEFGHVLDHQAGMQVIFHLKPDLSDTDIALRAQAVGVDILPLSGFASGPSDDNGLMLGFCGFSIDEMQPSLVALKGCFEDGAV